MKSIYFLELSSSIYISLGLLPEKITPCAQKLPKEINFTTSKHFYKVNITLLNVRRYKLKCQRLSLRKRPVSQKISKEKEKERKNGQFREGRVEIPYLSKWENWKAQGISTRRGLTSTLGLHSLVPRPVCAIRVSRGDLESSAWREFFRQARQVTSYTKLPRTTGNEAEDLTAQKKGPVFLITSVQSIHLREKFWITKRQPSRNENTKETNIKNGTFSNLLNCERI